MMKRMERLKRMERRTNSQTRVVRVANIQTTNISLISRTAPRINNTLANPYLGQHCTLVWQNISTQTRAGMQIMR